jgi:hypothetical protein
MELTTLCAYIQPNFGYNDSQIHNRPRLVPTDI